MIRSGVALLLAFSLTASAAGAQEAAPSSTGGDPIADLIGTLPPDQTTDEAEPEPTATAPADPSSALQSAPFVPGAQPAVPILTPQPPPPGYIRATPYDPASGPPAAAPPPAPPPAAFARPVTPPRPQLDRPVMIDETDRTPEGPPTALDLGYEARIKGSAASAQGLFGPLDGGWTVRGADGVALYGFQLVDRSGYGPLEGAWRAIGGSGRVGLIDSLDRQGSLLIVRITRVYGKTVVLTLTVSSDGSWAGDLSDETGVKPVTMRRN